MPPIQSVPGLVAGAARSLVSWFTCRISACQRGALTLQEKLTNGLFVNVVYQTR
jgi:hypothetical protein